MGGPSDAFEHTIGDRVGVEIDPAHATHLRPSLHDRVDVEVPHHLAPRVRDRIDVDLGPQLRLLQPAPWRAAHGLPGDAFQSRFTELVNGGWRLTDVSGSHDGTERFSGIWELSDGPGWRAHWGLPIGNYQTVFNDMTGQGFRPVRLSFYATPNGPHVCALWIAAEGGPAWEAHHDLTRAGYQDEFNRLRDAGYRPVDVTGYEQGGEARYAAVWERQPNGPAWAAVHHLTDGEYQAQFEALTAQGYVADKVVGYTVAGTVLHAAIWTQRPVPASSSGHAIDAADYQRVFDDRLYQGYRPRQVAGYAVPGGARYAAVWESDWFSWGTLQAVDSLIDTYMSTYNVPGLSMAMSNGGRLVFARARGWADRDAWTALSVRHRMRIASVSKPITSAATMLLAENGALALSDLVFGAAGRLGKTYGTLSYGSAEVSITIDHLLTHLSGFQNSPTDPMFDQPDRDQASLIGWVLDTRNPVTTPGTNYQYLNFGYLLLGRVIERVTGQGYADHVRVAILTPAGVTSMQIAGDTLATRATDEVVYYGQGGEDPYGMKVARMDAHGGWIATPIDLLRFLRVVDGRDGSDVLTTASVTTMTTGTAPNAAYARGLVRRRHRQLGPQRRAAGDAVAPAAPRRRHRPRRRDQHPPGRRGAERHAHRVLHVDGRHPGPARHAAGLRPVLTPRALSPSGSAS